MIPRVLPLRVLLSGLLLMPVLFGPASAAAQDRPSVTTLRIDQPVRVDGELSDSAWSSAEWAGGFVQRQPRTGEPSSESTEFAIAYTPDTLFIAVRAHDREPAKIMAKEMERDRDLFQDDSILLLFDTSPRVGPVHRLQRELDRADDRPPAAPGPAGDRQVQLSVAALTFSVPRPRADPGKGGAPGTIRPWSSAAPERLPSQMACLEN